MSTRTLLKRITLSLLLTTLVVAVVFCIVNVLLFNHSTNAIYDVPLPTIVASTDPTVIARGEHLADSLGKCKQCHGPNLGSGEIVKHGPFGTSRGPNLTAGKNGVGYTDAELARLIKHGIKRDGRTVLYMPSNETAWWTTDDVVALISYVRTMPAVDGEPSEVKFGVLAKIFDRLNLVTLDIARRIDHDTQETPPAPAPTPQYGAYVVRLCTRCHGDNLSGGPMPGAPPSMAVPSNLTPHATGLAAWSYEDFDRLLTVGVRKNGKALDPFMSLGALGKLDEVERRALWSYLRTLPAREFGGH